MAEFQELIKNFDRIRDYMRQFFVYGYKSRSDYGEKSSRTYDNEPGNPKALRTMIFSSTSSFWIFYGKTRKA